MAACCTCFNATPCCAAAAAVLKLRRRVQLLARQATPTFMRISPNAVATVVWLRSRQPRRSCRMRTPSVLVSRRISCCSSCAVGRIAEHGEQRSGAALLHDDRRQHHVERALRRAPSRRRRRWTCGERSSSAVSSTVTVSVSPASLCAGCLADRSAAARSGSPSDCACPRRSRCCSTRIAGCGPNGGVERAQQRRAGRRHEFLLHVRRVGRHAAQQVRRGGRGHGEGAVRAHHHAAADVHRRAVPGADLQMMNARARRDDVDDGIHRADLVKVDLIDRHVVDLRFGRRRAVRRRGSPVRFTGSSSGAAWMSVANRGERAAMRMFMRCRRACSRAHA